MRDRKTLSLFAFGLIAKIVFLFFAGSYYLTDLFIPFLDSAVQNPGVNPWGLMPPQHFPYGSVLFSILWLPRYLAFSAFGPVVLGTGAIGLALVKLPLLCLDLLLFETLRRIEKNKTKKLIIYYWLNPVLFYITYIHGQLDIASTVFYILALLFLTKKKTLLSAVTMAAATLCKFHVVLIIPLMMVYLWNREFAKEARKQIILWILVWGGISFAGFVPLLLAGNIGYATASSPEALRIFAAQISYGNDLTLQIGVLIVLGVLGRLCLSTTITEKGLFFGSTVLLSALLLATDPMPGWYFWVLPMFSLFFAVYLNVPKSLFWLHNAVYFLYFLPFFHKILESVPLGINVAFTILQASLAGILTAIWILSIRQEAQILRRASSTNIGVAGDSGAGKSRLTLLLQDIFNPNQTLVIEGDDYHRWERGHKNWQEFTHLHPKANYLSQLELHAKKLFMGFSVEQSQYDHQTGTFTLPRELRPAKAVIFQGLHSFYTRGMRDHFDLKIFLAPAPQIRLAWKLDRDIKERGHKPEQILASFAQRLDDAVAFIEPQRHLADWVIEFLPLENLTDLDIVNGKRPIIILKHTVPNDPGVDRIVTVLESLSLPGSDFKVSVKTIPGEIHRLEVEYSGAISSAQINEIAGVVFPNPRQTTRGRMPPVFHGNFDGLNQLMALALFEGIAGRGVK